ncbi:MAG: peroxiredoxin [Alphaproteobacteria bacterium GM7ARS4]|nr:peroxiredoxin [Alphaproteobacteria bacterium GM7ARS4]
MISIGQKIPSCSVFRWSGQGPDKVDSETLFKAQKTLLIAVPGGFTPTCNDQLPHYKGLAGDFKKKGIEAFYCLAINDIFVLQEWARSLGIDDTIHMIADGNGDFTRAVDMVCDLTAMGLGVRSKRYTVVIDGGSVTHLFNDDGPAFDKTEASKVLAGL